MLPKRFLHYEVVDKISSSDLSEIFKVINLKLADRVEALKVLSHKHRKNKDIHTRFKREAEILSSFNHPTIPVIYEINEYRNRPFITMEYLEGKSLLDIIEYKVLSLGRIVAIGKEVVCGLKEAHSRGIIHRDLKLSNIMISRDGGLKIIDFGLAATGWATPEEDRGMVIGTIPYMSPEQTRGEQLDHRTDIFSLGICLYELVSGRLPFFDPRADEVIRRVQELEPRSIREQRPETPEALEHCIFNCIEKEPRNRIQSMSELIEVLDDVEQHLKERGEDIQPTEGIRDQTEHLSLDLVAREEEFSLLSQAYFRALSGRGCTVFIQGEAGIGKTRLVEELTKKCRLAQVLIASGQAHPGTTTPYQPLVEALRYLMLGCNVVTDREIRHFLEDRFGSNTLQSRILQAFLLRSPSRNLEMAGRENLFDAVSDFLAIFSGQTPLMLILENMHWADQATLDLLCHLTGVIQGRKILLLVTYRANEPGKASALTRKLFTDIAEDRKSTGDAALLEIKRLNPKDTANLINFYFPGNRFKKAFARRIFEESDGNPLFILELLKLFARLGILIRKGEEWVQVKGEEAFPVPTPIHDLISRRLQGLNEAEIQVMEAAAVDGVSFTSESISALIHGDRLTVLNILRSLWRQQLIDLKGDAYRFNPSIVREVLYRQMMPELKREYHRLLARFYIDSPPPGKGTPAEVARHFHAGGNSLEAIEYYLKAGYAALNLHADREALDYFDQALELLESTAPENEARLALEVQLNRGEIFIRMGEPERSVAAADEAMALAKSSGLPESLGMALKLKGKICHLNGNPDKTMAHLEEALICTRSPSDRAEIINLLGLTAENSGDHKTALNRFAESLAISKTAKNTLRMAQTLNHMGRTALNQGDPGAALGRFRKALDITSEIGDRRGIAVNTNNVGILLRRMDRLHDSLRLLFRAARIFKEIRYPNGAANTLWNIGIVFWAMGDRRKGEKFVLKAMRIFEKIGSQHGVPLCQLSLGNILAAAGEIDAAIHCFTQTTRIGKRTGYTRVVAYGEASRGALELTVGRIENAINSLKRAAEGAKECGDLILKATVLGHSGLARCLAGDKDEALVLVQHALGAAERSRDHSALSETCLLKSRVELITGHLTRAKISFSRASTAIDRNARPARKADLIFGSGLLECVRRRPQQAQRKLETALALRRKLHYPLKELECLHGLGAAFTLLDRRDSLRQVESWKQEVLDRVAESMAASDDRAVFYRFNKAWGAFSFLQAEVQGQGI